MMKYEVLTLQYGTFKDVSEYNDINEMLNDLSLLSEMESFEVLSISRNGVNLSRLRVRILLSLSKAQKGHCLKSYLKKKGCL